MSKRPCEFNVQHRSALAVVNSPQGFKGRDRCDAVGQERSLWLYPASKQASKQINKQTNKQTIVNYESYESSWLGPAHTHIQIC